MPRGGSRPGDLPECHGSRIPTAFHSGWRCCRSPRRTPGPLESSRPVATCSDQAESFGPSRFWLDSRRGLAHHVLRRGDSESDTRQPFVLRDNRTGHSGDHAHAGHRGESIRVDRRVAGVAGPLASRPGRLDGGGLGSHRRPGWSDRGGNDHAGRTDRRGTLASPQPKYVFGAMATGFAAVVVFAVPRRKREPAAGGEPSNRQP